MGSIGDLLRFQKKQTISPNNGWCYAEWPTNDALLVSENKYYPIVNTCVAVMASVAYSRASAIPGRCVSALSLTTWFRHSLSGMKEFEVLSRASASILEPSKNDGFVNIIASQHVTHPFYWTSYFDEDKHAFLMDLRETDVQWSLEVRNPEDGSILVTIPLKHNATRHPTRDVSLISIEQSAYGQMANDLLHSYGVNIIPRKLSRETAAEGAPLSFAGHFLKPSIDQSTGADTSLLIPQMIAGRVVARTPLQVFAKTDTILEMGMCGGAVIHEETGECVGIVEGIVPSNDSVEEVRKYTQSDTLVSQKREIQKRARELLAGCAVFVESEDIQKLVRARDIQHSKMGNSSRRFSALTETTHYEFRDQLQDQLGSVLLV